MTVTPVEAHEIPTLEGTDVMSAKKFFETLGRRGAAFHADDDPTEIIHGPQSRRLFTPEAAAKVSEAITALRAAAASWPDPDFLYSACGEGEFEVEKDYPGFVLDASVTASIGIAYASLPGRDLPTFLAHDGARFFAVTAPERTGRFSDMKGITVTETDGVRFVDGSIDVSRARLMEDRAVTAGDFSEIDAALEAAGASPAP